MNEILPYIDTDMAIAIQMQSTGLSYRELEETPFSVLLAVRELKHYIDSNKGD